ncbi:MAG: peptidylprolyl isomerase [Saprospiraceae bacterium]|nr:peptidylprolyl isomerase [Saprospiraceae bacterium]
MRILVGCLVFCFFSFNAFAQQKTVIDKVISTIGGELILLSEVEEQHALMAAQNGQLPADARCGIVENIMVSKLMLNQAKLDSIEVGEEEVEAQLNARIERILTFMNGDISQFEAYYGQSIGEVKEQFREDLRSKITVDRMRGNILSSVTVTPSEVKKFFSGIPVDSLPYFNSEVEVGEIVYKPKVNAIERKKAVDKLEGIRKRILEGGEDFAELAQTFSDDASARAGGDLGWAKRGKFVPEFEAAAYRLEENEVSDVIETDFGFHILQLLERRGNSIRVRHILVKPEITDADLELARIHLDSVRNLIMWDSLTFSQAVKRYSDEDVQSYNNDGRIINPGTGNTFFEIGDLDPDIYFTIDTMAVESLSKPFEFADQIGETMFRIVQLQSRTAPHKANLQQDYSKIQAAAIESKKNEFINNWVEEKINSTFISIDGMYDGCPNLDEWEKRKDIRP